MTSLNSVSAMVMVPVLFLTTATGASGQTRHDLFVSVTDASAADSPIKLSAGKISVIEELYPGHVRTKWSMHIELANVSPKGIIAYDISVVAIPDHGSAAQFEGQRDDFFYSDLTFVSNSRDSLDIDGPGWTDTPSTTSTDPSKVREPSAELKVKFVEFVDGTNFGDSIWGKSLSDGRSAEIVRMNEILEAYRQGGDVALRTTLARDLNRPEDPPYTRHAILTLNDKLNTEGLVQFATELAERVRTGQQRFGVGK